MGTHRRQASIFRRHRDKMMVKNIFGEFAYNPISPEIYTALGEKFDIGLHEKYATNKDTKVIFVSVGDSDVRRTQIPKSSFVVVDKVGEVSPIANIELIEINFEAWAYSQNKYSGAWLYIYLDYHADSNTLYIRKK